MKNILLILLNYDHFQTGQLRAFQHIFGDSYVKVFDYLQLERDGRTKEEINNLLIEAAQSYKSDWIFCQFQETNIVTAETLISIKQKLPKCIITHWTGDYRETVSPYLSSICKATDVTFISNSKQIDNFIAAGAKAAYYLQIGLDWKEDVLGIVPWTPTFKVPDVVFIGNHYGPDNFKLGTQQRVDVIRTLQKAKINVGVVGSSWPEDINTLGTCTVKQQHHIYKKAKVALNINHINNAANYYSDRQLIAMASGTPVACWHIPNIESEFEIGADCVTFTSPIEAVRVVEFLLENPKKAKEIGRNGKYRVLREHDWTNRVIDAMNILEELSLLSF